MRVHLRFLLSAESRSVVACPLQKATRSLTRIAHRLTCIFTARSICFLFGHRQASTSSECREIAILPLLNLCGQYFIGCPYMFNHLLPVMGHAWGRKTAAFKAGNSLSTPVQCPSYGLDLVNRQMRRTWHNLDLKHIWHAEFHSIGESC